MNLVELHIEAYTDPSGPTESPDYRERRDYRATDAVPVRVDGVEVGRLAVGELLP